MNRNVLVSAGLCSACLIAVLAVQAFRASGENADGATAELARYKSQLAELRDENATLRERQAANLARLESLERLARRSGSETSAGEGSPHDSDGSAEDETEQESADTDPLARADDGLAARVATIERRLESLESDPVERGYRYIQSENAELRRQGILALERIAARDPEARATIRDMLQDPDKSVRWWALDTLADVGDKESIAAISAMLSDNDTSVRSEAINSLNRLQSRESAPAIAALYGDADPKIRQRVIDAIGDLRYTDGAGVLLEALGDSSRDVRREAIENLRSFGPKNVDAQAVLGPLRALYEDNPGGDRLRLASALRSFGESGPYQAELQRLTQTALGGGSESARREAIRDLSRYMRKDAMPVLSQIASENEPNASIRGEAARALDPSKSRRR